MTSPSSPSCSCAGNLNKAFKQEAIEVKVVRKVGSGRTLRGPRQGRTTLSCPFSFLPQRGGGRGDKEPEEGAGISETHPSPCRTGVPRQV